MPRGPPPMNRRLRKNEFYCVRCKAPVKCDSADICYKVYQNPRTHKSVHALKCECVECGTNLTRFISAAQSHEAKRCYKRF